MVYNHESLTSCALSDVQLTNSKHGGWSHSLYASWPHQFHQLNSWSFVSERLTTREILGKPASTESRPINYLQQQLPNLNKRNYLISFIECKLWCKLFPLLNILSYPLFFVFSLTIYMSSCESPLVIPFCLLLERDSGFRYGWCWHAGILRMVQALYHNRSVLSTALLWAVSCAVK